MNREEAARILDPSTCDIEFEKDISHWSERLELAMTMGAEALRSGWVKTADRLPDDDDPVPVIYVGYTDNLPHNDAIAVYAYKSADNYAGAWYWQDSDGVDYNPVSVSITHWLPIPPLPVGSLSQRSGTDKEKRN